MASCANCWAYVVENAMSPLLSTNTKYNHVPAGGLSTAARAWGETTQMGVGVKPTFR